MAERATTSLRLGRLLREQRVALRPEYVGLAGHRGRLRRFEVAQLLGVSASYVAALETGRVRAIDAELAEDLARLFRLDHAARELVQSLVTGRPPRRAAARDAPPAGLAGALARAQPGLTLLLSADLDVLYWSADARELFAGHVGGYRQPLEAVNLAVLLACDPHVRASVQPGAELLRLSAWALRRRAAGPRAAGARLAAVLGRLALVDEVAAAFAEPAPARQPPTPEVVRVHHPTVGPVAVRPLIVPVRAAGAPILVQCTPASPRDAHALLLLRPHPARQEAR
ncbi:helix-turn-helix domain-containing protein [Jiangella endophytica]|uniref:helix-turn-helix domain-containing protein n=1 Tax=Jiangella endophytica TaxID=1623398 RepID=UPI000E356323|nr:helix-turn-helix transcriptional regulator [Jiangella endophytica]